jgi:membrane protein DedA with SNARE-associated domain
MGIDSFIQWINQLDALWIYAAVFSIAYIENILPPAPSDVIVAFGGYLVGVGRTDFVTTLLFATAGSTLGFVTMYRIGGLFGDKILEQGKIKFLPVESVRRVEQWFKRYGYWLIIVNRFLAGTRAVVSFFAGMSELKLWKTTLLCFGSALIWNSVLIYVGNLLGQRWKEIGFYLSTYSQIVTVIVLVVVLVLVAKFLYGKRNGKSSG